MLCGPPRLRPHWPIRPLRSALGPQRGSNSRLGTALRRSYDLEIALQFPIGHRIEPLPPFPFARGGKVVDEIVAEPVAGEIGLAKCPCRFDQRSRRTGNIFSADVGTCYRRCGSLELLFYTPNGPGPTCG